MTDAALRRGARAQPTVLRIDHVETYYTYLGTPMTLTEADKGWLVLLFDGEIVFYEGRQPDLDGAPTLRGGWGAGLVQRRRSVRVDFGGTKRFVIFTGLALPSGDGLDSAGDVVEVLGEVFDSLTLKAAALVIKGGGLSWQSMSNPDKKERRQEARAFWMAFTEAATPVAGPTVAPKTVLPQGPEATSADRAGPAETSPELVAGVAARLGCTDEMAKEVVYAVFAVISAELESAGEVRVSGLGTFVRRTRPSGSERSATPSVTFRSSTRFRAAVEHRAAADTS